MATKFQASPDPTAPPPEASADRLLKLDEVKDLTGLSRPTIYRFMKQRGFPQPYKPGGYASRWSEAEVHAWRESQR